MDEYVGKKAAGGHGLSSKGSSIQCGSRLGCSTRLSTMKGTQIGDLGKVKYVKATFCSMSSKIVAGNSSKSLSSKQTLRQDKAAIAESNNSRGNTEDSECNNTQHFIEELHIKSQQIEDAEFLKSNPTKVGIRTLLPDSEELELPILERVSTKSSESSDSCIIASSSESHVQVNHHLGSGSQAVSSRSFFRHSTYASRNSGNAASPGTPGTGVHRSSGLKSLIYSSVSAVLPSSCSSSNFGRDRQIDAVSKRPSGVENSAANGKGTIGPSTGRHSGSTPTGISGLSRSRPEHLMHQQTLLPIRNQPTTRDDVVLVRTCRASTGDARTRLSEQGVGNVLPVHEPTVIAHPKQNQVSISEAVPESSLQSSSIELPGVGNVLPVHEPVVSAHPQQNQVSILKIVPESLSRSSSMELPGVGNVVPIHEPIAIAHPKQNQVSISEAVLESSLQSSSIELPGVGNVLPIHEPAVIAHPKQNQVFISEAVPESSLQSSSIELPGVGNVLPVHEPVVSAHPQQNQVSILKAVPESLSRSSSMELLGVGNVIPIHEPIAIAHPKQNQVSISEAVPESSLQSSSIELLGVGNVLLVHEPAVIAHPKQNQVSISEVVPESSLQSSSIESSGVGNVLVHEPIVSAHPQQNQVAILKAVLESLSRSSSMELPGVGNVVPIHEPIAIAHLQQNQVSISEAIPESSSRSSSIGLPGVGNVVPVHEPIVIAHPQQNQVSISEAVPESSSRSSSTELAGVGNVLPVHEPLVIAPPQQNQVSISEAVPERSSQSSPIESPLVSLNSSGLPGSSSRAARNRMVSHPEDSSTHTFHDRIEEVFLALERIERAAELTHERLLALGADLSSGSLSFRDQHRDMRMDIDNMSYEELLALEEQMGTVSTGLSKDQLSGCLKRSIYTPASEVSGITGSDDDPKCSICLQEYVSGDDVGKLACKHHYHVACIHQWLGQKNWCAVCKAWAIPS